MILGVNVDHVATVREAREETEPDPEKAAALAIRGGADGITIHLREDRRHIHDRDLKKLRKKVKIELNLEMAATKEMIGIALKVRPDMVTLALKVRPDMVTLVPEKRAELTTEGGLNLKRNRKKIHTAINAIQGKGIPVSLFINPSVSDVKITKEVGARMVEIHTGLYANARGKKQTMVEIHTGLYANARGKKQTEEFKRVQRAVEKARSIGLLVNAGHGLNYSNIKRIAAL
jgi:pyridoxine 5-phosphate synthase